MPRRMFTVRQVCVCLLAVLAFVILASSTPPSPALFLPAPAADAAFAPPAADVATPARVSPANSTVVATSPHRADGVDQSVITVTVRDADNHPIAATRVWAAVTQPGAHLIGSPGLTDANGQAVFRLTSTVPQVVIPTVLVYDGPLTVPIAQPLITFRGASLAGRVYFDADGDGVLDAGEPGIGGAVLTLRDSQGAVVQTTATLEDGSFSFNELAPGPYQVTETDPPDYGSSTPNTLTVVLAAFSEVGGLLFGDTSAGRVEGVVWNDANTNGVLDEGETGIPGVSVALSGGSGAVTTTTDDAGHYELRAGAPFPTAPQNFSFATGLAFVTEPPTARIRNAGFDQGLFSVSDPAAPIRNSDFGQAGYDLPPTSYPSNYSFTTPGYNLDPSTYPQNYNFETANLDGWTGSAGTDVTTGSHDGSYAGRIVGPNHSLVSAPFTVPTGTQTLRWWWRTRWGTEAFVQLLDASGQTVRRTVVNNGGTDQQWREAFADIRDFQGQTIRVKFFSSGYADNYILVDNLALQVSVPGWTVQGNTAGSNGARYGIGAEGGIDGPYAFLIGPNLGLISSPFTVPTEAQTLRWWWKTRWGTEAFVQILDASDQTVLRTVVNNGGTNGQWREAFADIRAFQGQTIRVKFFSSSEADDYILVDNLALQVSVPGWTVQGNTVGSNGARYGISAEGGIDGPYAFLIGPNLGLISSPFTVPAEAQTLRWWWKTRWGTEAFVQILDASDQTVLRTVVDDKGTDQQWREAFADIRDFQGQTIRVKFFSSSYADDYILVDNLALQVSVPGWTVQGNTAGSNGARYGIGADQGVDGPYAFLIGPNLGLISAPFTVPAEAQTLRWWWKTRWGTEAFVQLLDASDQTVLRTVVDDKGTDQQWREAFADIRAFQGQTIRVKFFSSSYPDDYILVDNLALEVSVPGWTVQGNTVGSNGARYGISAEGGIDGPYAFLIGPNLGLISSPFTVPTEAQTLRWWWKTRWGTEAFVQILDASGQTVRRTVVNNGGTGQQWREAFTDIRDFQGQTIRVKFFSSSYADDYILVASVWLDPVTTRPYSLTETNPPGWSSTTQDTVAVSLFGGQRVVQNFGDYLSGVTPTLTPTPSQTPTPTVTVTPVITVTPTPTPTAWRAVRGRVQLQDRPSAGDVQVNVGTYTAMVAADGTFVAVVPPGQYNVTASHPRYLPRWTTVSVAYLPVTDVTLPMTTLLGGDTNGDLRIDYIDLWIVALNYGSSPPSLPGADINGDGEVDVRDLMLVGMNYGLVGPQPWASPQLSANKGEAGPDRLGPRPAVVLRQPDHVAAGEVFCVQARLVGGQGLAAVDLTLHYDPARLTLLDGGDRAGACQAGDSLGQGRLSPTVPEVFVVPVQRDTTGGVLRYAVTQRAGAADGGRLVSLRFQSRVEGRPGVTLGQTTLATADQAGAVSTR